MYELEPKQSFNYARKYSNQIKLDPNMMNERNYSAVSIDSDYSQRTDMSSKKAYPTNKFERQIQNEARKASSRKFPIPNRVGLTPTEDTKWGDQSRPLSMISNNDIKFHAVEVGYI